MKRIACSGIGLVLSLGLLALPAGAQNQGSQNQGSANSQSSASGTSTGSSLGDYARQVRKDPVAKPKQRVFDNDNLPTEDKLSVIGPTLPPLPPPTLPSTPSRLIRLRPQPTPKVRPMPPEEHGQGSGRRQGPAQELLQISRRRASRQRSGKASRWTAKWGDKLSAQKDQIDLNARELDVLQREYQIRAAAMYADAGNRMRNSGDWDKQDAQYKQQIADKQKSLDDAKQKLEDLQESARKAGVPASISEP